VRAPSDDGLKNSLPVAEWARKTAPSSLQYALVRACDSAIISLSLGLPDPELFPIAALSEASSRVFASGRDAFQYTVPCPKLKHAISRHMAARGVDCSPHEILLTVGAQQGLSLLCRMLLDSDAVIVEEAYTYTGFQQAAEPYSPRVISNPTDVATGINLDSLEEMLSTGIRPAFLYVMADGHNPLGATMPLQNRQRLAQLAREFRMPVIEDDPYGFLTYDGSPIPPIRAFESEWVYYVGSLSKLLAPSLRVGWIVGPASMMQTLAVVKEASDINMSNFAQWVVAEFLEMGCLPTHVNCLLQEYGDRRRVMNSALAAEFPEYCHWRIPHSGVFFWIELPAAMNGSDLLRAALEQEHVAFLPAEGFSRGHRVNGLRLNFSRHNRDLINEAVHRIGKVIKGT
jgi:2-aminoadipate transaminase